MVASSLRGGGEVVRKFRKNSRNTMTIDTFKITKTTWVEYPTGTSVVYYSGWKQGMNARIGKVLKTNKNVTTIKRIYRKDKI